MLETAKDIALLPDAFVFVDDNPAERAIIHEQIPEAAVPEITDVQVVRRMRDCVFSGICSEVEYGVHNAGNARDRCQLFSLKESYEKAKNDIGMVWPSDYAEYDARFSLKKGDQRALLSCCLPVAHAEYVASVTLLASPLRNI